MALLRIKTCLKFCQNSMEDEVELLCEIIPEFERKKLERMNEAVELLAEQSTERSEKQL